MKGLLARLEVIEATGVLEIDVGWVNGNYQRILFHSVRTASADRVREMAAPRRHLALVCFLHQAWRDTLDQAVDMYGKLLDRNRKLVEARLDDMLKAQRQAVDRIVHRYRRLGAVLLDPDVADDELRARLLSTVTEVQTARGPVTTWRTGRGATGRPRFEQTAERHAGLSRFAGPFLSRMKFVDEQGEGASPTLSALRAYREHRAAGRRGAPPDAPLDFAPAALQPLIRRDGVTDRRRWESALFLKVRDEIQTGNLAIDGAKNFGRFEAFFLPAAQWERVREAFWARTGFPVDPAAAVEQLKARLSDAFDRFLEGVADNRQVAFDDDGWRLKTDAAEQPDPAQSESLAELHRWLDARSRSIRLADLVIEGENDLGFSVHFQQPGEKRVDPWGGVRAARRDPRPRLQPRPLTPWRTGRSGGPTVGSRPAVFAGQVDVLQPSGEAWAKSWLDAGRVGVAVLVEAEYGRRGRAGGPGGAPGAVGDRRGCGGSPGRAGAGRVRPRPGTRRSLGSVERTRYGRPVAVLWVGLPQRDETVRLTEKVAVGVALMARARVRTVVAVKPGSRAGPAGRSGRPGARARATPRTAPRERRCGPTPARRGPRAPAGAPRPGGRPARAGPRSRGRRGAATRRPVRGRPHRDR